MSYRKAEEILPRELIEVIQQYVDGENIYIPRKLEHRKGWGERTQARQELDARNSAICREHREGASVPRLSQKYYLTEKCEKGFRSWIRLKDNHIEQEVKFPESFLKPRK